MNRLIWKLLRQHISIGQLAGFFLANLCGMLIVLLGIQFYRDVLPVFTHGDSFMKKEYVVVTKRISTIGGLAGKDNTFSPSEISALQQQPFTRSIGAFTPSQFEVSASVGLKRLGIHLSTEMFFESVPNPYVDVSLDRWHFDEASRTIPIIIPRNYLNLYNFGFAQSRNLPKLSDQLVSMVQLHIDLRGHGRQERFEGRIVGFSNRLNTILVPQDFMDWANRTFAPEHTAHPSRLIVEVDNPTDTAINDYFAHMGYETEGDDLNAGRTTYFLRLTTGIVMGVGLFISVLSFYILMLSIFLLLQKNSVKLENLLLAGYSPTQVAMPYCLLTLGLNLGVLLLTIGGVTWMRSLYMDSLQLLLPGLQPGSPWPCLAIGIVLFALVSLLNIWCIRRKITGIWAH